MKIVRFIYNPVSGNGVLRDKIDGFIEMFQRHGFQIVPHKLLGKSDIKKAFSNCNIEEYSAIVAGGGDGTVHEVINELIARKIELPLGIIPSGTSNDFANFLELPKEINNYIDIITAKERTEFIDIGKINNKYFINVVSGGVLTNIAHKAEKRLKNSIGMMAYYLKALEEIPNIKPFEVEIECQEYKAREKILMFLVLNSSIAGGFKIAPNAHISDGYLDVCLIKDCNLGEFANLFVKLLRGEHVQDEKFMTFQTKDIIINTTEQIETDIDGETGEDFPLHISALPGRLKIFR